MRNRKKGSKGPKTFYLIFNFYQYRAFLCQEYLQTSLSCVRDSFDRLGLFLIFFLIFFLFLSVSDSFLFRIRESCRFTCLFYFLFICYFLTFFLIFYQYPASFYSVFGESCQALHKKTFLSFSYPTNDHDGESVRG